jgi:hypothetical protein
MSETPALLPEEGGEYNDFVLNAPGVWVRVDNLVVHIGRTRDGWGINVDVYTSGQSEDDPLASLAVPFEEEA